jgi:tagatose 1,6-diphosphate aldolase
MSPIQPGKMRGLQATANSQQIFTILALDHGASLAGTIRPDQPDAVSYAQMVSLKRELLTNLAPYASAVLLDPVYGLAPAVLSGALPGNCGMLLAVEDGDYASVRKEARLFAGWSVAQARRAGANAIKCFFYYHPEDSAVAEHQEMFVRELVTACHDEALPLFAEPLSYGTTPQTQQAVVVETARRISRLGIDLLKTEFPLNVQYQPDQSAWASACEALTAACQTPWVLLSAGVDYPAFADQVRVACAAGASGYLAGRAIWKEGVSRAEPERQTFWQTTARQRLAELTAIANELARPWTDFYPFGAEPAPQGWHQKL